MRRLLGMAFVVLLATSCVQPQKRTGGRDAAQLKGGSWSRLPPAPIAARADVIGVWSGTELLVWGGASGPGRTDLHADGAAYNPRTKRWRVIPPAPLNGRTAAAAHAWTGQELVVWGGYDRIREGDSHVVGDGAAYNPSTNAWRMLPPGPLGPRSDAVAIWTSKELIIVGGHRGDGRANPGGAAYDPATDQWRLLPTPSLPAGHDVSYPFTVWTGSRLMVWWGWTHVETDGNTQTIGGGIDRVDYDPAADSWALADPIKGSPRGIHDVFWTGAEVLIPAAAPWCATTCPSSAGADLVGSRSGPDGMTWRPIAHGPVDIGSGPTLWTGAAMVRISDSFNGDTQSGDAAAWDPVADRWFALRPAPLVPSPGTVAVWTGTELLLWGDLRRQDRSSDMSVAVAGGLRFGN